MISSLKIRRALHPLLCGIVFTILACEGDKDEPPARIPSISAISPTTGREGISVKIKGSAFSATPVENEVTFNGIVAEVVSSSDSVINAIVPTGATSGPVTVKVKGTNASGSITFNVLTTPLSCRIHTVKIQTNNVFSTYKFTYDNLGRITMTEYHNGTGGYVKAVFEYTAGPVAVYTYANNNVNWVTKALVSTYPDGTLQHIDVVNNLPGAHPSSTEFAHYFGAVMSETTTYKTQMQTALYRWINGNMVGRITLIDNNPKYPKDSVTYEYHLDKAYDLQILDARSRSIVTVDGLFYVRMYGFPVWASRNLVKKMMWSYDKAFATFDYELDSEGKVIKSKATSDDGTVSTATYEYTCQ